MTQKRVIAFRFSAMGDVAMCVSVVAQFCLQNPDVQIIFVTRKHFKAMFPALSNLVVYPIEPKTTHKGFKGLLKLFRELQSVDPTHIADLHENVRTRVLKIFFRFTKVKIATLDKGRSERKKLLKYKKCIVLKSVTERYVHVLHELGFKFQFNQQQFLTKRSISSDLLRYFPFLKKSTLPTVGIFPFAQHLQKVYPLELMAKVIQGLSNHLVEIFVFGAGAQERVEVEPWLAFGENVHSTIDRMNLELEMKLISQLDVMLSMDTAGMHMASLFGVPVVSVWGATHPNAGFLGVGQKLENVIQTDLVCRPCSIYGNKKCHRGDMACMYQISPEQIVSKLLSVIHLKLN